MSDSITFGFGISHIPTVFVLNVSSGNHSNDRLVTGSEPVFSKRGIVAVRSLKSGDGEFLQDAPLTNEQISQLEAGLSTVLLLVLFVLETVRYNMDLTVGNKALA